MTNETWTRYMRATAYPDNDKVIAEKVGVSPSTVGRWRSGEIDPKPRQVVAFARAYAKSPLGALIASGYLDEVDLADEMTLGLPSDLDEISTYALLDELRTRMELIGDYVGWLRSIGLGTGSPSNLSPTALRYVDPGIAPAEVDPSVYMRPIDQHLHQSGLINGKPTYGLNTEYEGTIGDLPPFLREQMTEQIRRTETGADVIEGRFGVADMEQDEPDIKQPPAKQRTAAMKGTRKADAAPYAE